MNSELEEQLEFLLKVEMIAHLGFEKGLKPASKYAQWVFTKGIKTNNAKELIFSKRGEFVIHLLHARFYSNEKNTYF